MELTLIDVGLAFTKEFIASLTKSKAPQQVIDAFSGAITALEEHKNDVVTQASLESQRG